MKFLILTLPLLACQSCLSTGTGPAPVKPPAFSAPGTIYLEGEPVWNTLAEVRAAIGTKGRLVGNTLDLQGYAIDGRRLKQPKRVQDEKAVPLRVNIDGFTLKNGTVRNIPGGIVVKADSTRWENLIFRDIGEDALSTIKDAGEETVVKNCRFYNRSEKDSGDKSLQLNDARDAVVEGCYFTGGITALRLQESSAKAKKVTAWLRGNTFENVPTAANVAGPTTVIEGGNVWKNVRKRWVLGPEAAVREEAGK